MKVLLTGASGYLGRYVLAHLRAQGCEVAVLGRSLPPGFEDVPLVHCDLLDGANLAEALQTAGASHLMHLAWTTEYGKYWTSPLNFRWADATLRLLQAFADAGGQHVAIAGSCAEYDWAAGYLREDVSPYAPATLYGVAKDATRRMAAALCAARDVSLAWGHIFFPFGPGEAPQRMLPSLVRVFRGEAPPFGVNVAAYRGMLPVPDAAAALATLLLQGCGGNFNICSGEPSRIGDVVATLARLCGADPAPVLALATARPGDPPMLVGDSTRLRATGWRPQLTLEQGLAAMVVPVPVTTKVTP
ncbi:MAG: NAD(P)-dependent oxidoreductase [Burkholderiales bacterium]|nr:NAD(P)-dependent oxidoreductase [Burkholderiales bacterium]